MKCLDREELFGLIHGMLSPEDQAEASRHLETCAACRGAAAEYARLDAVLGEWKPAEPTPAFDARVRSALATVAPPRRGVFGLGWLPILVPALIVLVVFACVLVIRERGGHSPAQTAPAVAASGNGALPSAQAEASDAQAESELAMYQNLSLLEDYDMLRDFDVLSEMPGAGKKVEN